MISTGVYIFKYKPGGGAGFYVLWIKIDFYFSQLFSSEYFFSEEL